MTKNVETLLKVACDMLEHSCEIEGADFGIRACCHVRDYKPHEKTCALNNAINAVKGENK